MKKLIKFYCLFILLFLSCSTAFGNVSIISTSVRTTGHIEGSDLIRTPDSDYFQPFSDGYDTSGVTNATEQSQHTYTNNDGILKVNSSASITYPSSSTIQLSASGIADNEHASQYDNGAKASFLSSVSCRFQLVSLDIEEMFTFQYGAPEESGTYASVRLSDITANEILFNQEKWISDVYHEPDLYTLPLMKSDFSHIYELELSAYTSVGWGCYSGGRVYTQMNVIPAPSAIVLAAMGLAFVRKTKILIP